MKVINKIFLGVLVLLFHSTRLFSDEQQTAGCMKQDSEQITLEQFEILKKGLPSSLKEFVEEFKTWDSIEKSKIDITGLSFFIKNLTEEHAKRDGVSLGYWIDCHTRTQRVRARFIYCLKYLQQ